MHFKFKFFFFCILNYRFNLNYLFSQKIKIKRNIYLLILLLILFDCNNLKIFNTFFITWFYRKYNCFFQETFCIDSLPSQDGFFFCIDWSWEHNASKEFLEGRSLDTENSVFHLCSHLLICFDMVGAWVV